MQQSQPIVLSLENTSDTEIQCHLFDKFYRNDSLIIKSFLDNISYEKIILMKSAIPFKIGFIKITNKQGYFVYTKSNTGNNSYILQNCFTLKFCGLKETNITFSKVSFCEEMNDSITSDISDITLMGADFFVCNVPPKSSFIFYFYPSAVLDISNSLK